MMQKILLDGVLKPDTVCAAAMLGKKAATETTTETTIARWAAIIG